MPANFAPQGKKKNWWMWIGIGLAVIFIIVILFMVFRSSSSSTSSAPSPLATPLALVGGARPISGTGSATGGILPPLPIPGSLPGGFLNPLNALNPLATIGSGISNIFGGGGRLF